MIRNIYYHIIDYKEIHPIRFWEFVLGTIVLFALITFIVKNIITKNRKGSKSIKDIKVQNINTEIENKTEEENESKNTINIFSNYKVLISVVIGQSVLIIGLIVALMTHNNSTSYRTENPSNSNSKYIFGIDISHYQGGIDWNELRTSHHPIEFIFIRATMGVNGKDKRFKENWQKAKQYNYIRGAYHYYRSNENSTKQFENFSNNVNLIKGDFIPILDIEKQSKFGKKNLREGILNWLKLAEKKYGVKPLIYTGLTFYLHNLKGYIDNYPLWISAYSGKSRLKKVNWTFHQFTENVSVKGVRSTVDGNDFKGELEDLKKMCIN